MKLLRCIICEGEIILVDSADHSINRKVRCKKCGFTNCGEHLQKKEPEIIIIRKRN
jgi:DNA-directed RNA polymerase subunit RPC12/RpoP